MKRIVACLGLSMVVMTAREAHLGCSFAEYKANMSQFAMRIDAMKQNPIKYYKRWALMYCLGYTSDENKVLSTSKQCKNPHTMDNPIHIDNLVKLFGDEPLNEIKRYIDERKELYGIAGIVNECFDDIYFYCDEKIQNIVDKYLILKDEYYERKAQ